jgi:glycosyltransferase involved in cell wall biosynthesis
VRILIAHARYIDPGGEEAVIDTQERVLVALGHEVVRYEQHNAGIDAGIVTKLRGAGASVWSRRAQRAIADVIGTEHPDVLHVHNIFQAMSPSIYGAARRAGVPVVQHLHNARYVCVNAFLERDGHSCTDCVRKTLTWPGVVHRCYRDSLPQSVAATAVQLTHRARRTYHRDVDRFLAVSEALASTLRDARVVPASRLTVCHNGLDPDPGEREPGDDRGYALYVGRLSPEKGVDVLIEAAAAVPELPLRIAGDGPQRGALEAVVAGRQLRHVTFLGRVDTQQLAVERRGARVTVVPSVGADPLPTAIIEAAATGLPTIGARTGGIPELVVDGVTGTLVPAGNPSALAAALRAAHAQPSVLASMGRAARADFEQRFSGAAFGARLVSAYESVLR